MMPRSPLHLDRATICLPSGLAVCHRRDRFQPLLQGGLANPPRFQVIIAASAAPAGVAQLVEQRIRNAKVGSSTLFTGTKFSKKATFGWPFCIGSRFRFLQVSLIRQGESA